MNKLSRSKRPESQSGSKSERTSQIESAQALTGLTGIEDRSDRSSSSKTGRPVWPVSPTGLTGGVQKTPKIQFQTVNREQIASKLDETWRIASFLPKSVSPRNLTLKISIAREFRDEIKGSGVFFSLQEIEFRRASDSRGFKN